MVLLNNIIESKRGHTTIKIIVSPNAKKDEISGLDEWRGGLNVKIKEKAVQGKANRSIVRFFANIFGLKSNCVEIIKGEKSREKMLRIRIRKTEALDILEKILGSKEG